MGLFCRSKAVIALSCCALLTGCNTDHYVSSGFLEFETDPGYVWASGDWWDFDVVWKPGLRHPTQANVMASGSADFWEPLPGYRWSDATLTVASDARSTGLTSAIWTKGLRNAKFPHVSSGAQEGRWAADKGYDFAASDGLAVEWVPGKSDPDNFYYESGRTEGAWVLKPGYVESVGLFGSRIVNWSAGRIHPKNGCLQASYEEGRWVALDGYEIRKDGLTLKIYQIRQETDWGQVWAGGIAAIAGFYFGRDQSDDGAAATYLGRPLAREFGDAGARHAVGALMGDTPGLCDGVPITGDLSTNI